MDEPTSNQYQCELALRREVEKKSRRSLTDEEWVLVAPDWSAPYDDQDVAELVQAVRDGLSEQPTLSLEEKARRHRRAHVQRAAIEAQEMVEAFREDLFGRRGPPFRNRGIEAAAWIEARVKATENKRLRLEVTVPTHLGFTDALFWLIDYLTSSLSRYPQVNGENDSLTLRRYLEEFPAIQHISWRVSPLAYLGLNSEGEINIKRVSAPDGTLLGRLQSMAQELANATGWEPYAAVHHLLTGGIVASPAVMATSPYRLGPKVFGDDHPMVLEIPDPDSVTEQDLVKAFKQERCNEDSPWNQLPRQRARVSPKSERVAALVEGTPGMSWTDRLEEWNRQYPDERCRTVDAIKKAYSRANGH